jgi:hypothetical protein
MYAKGQKHLLRNGRVRPEAVARTHGVDFSRAVVCLTPAGSSCAALLCIEHPLAVLQTSDPS